MPRRFKSIPVDQLFWSIVAPTLDTDACWDWPKARNNSGYGLFRLPMPGGREEALAHRVAWILTYGPIPPGRIVCHTCDNPPCVRPSHLWLGTNRANLIDCISKGRMPYTTRKSSGPRRIAAWSRHYTECIDCHSTARPYGGNGRCARCQSQHYRLTSEKRQAYIKAYNKRRWAEKGY